MLRFYPQIKELKWVCEDLTSGGTVGLIVIYATRGHVDGWSRGPLTMEHGDLWDVCLGSVEALVTHRSKGPVISYGEWGGLQNGRVGRASCTPTK